MNSRSAFFFIRDSWLFFLTFSRFARRVQQNAGGVTDYGAANNSFLIWQNLKKKGFYNDAPNLLKLGASL